jgi:hypothetical protein
MGELSTGFWSGDHSEDLGVGGRITLRWMDLREIRIDGANWIWLTEDRVRWASMGTVMNLRFP